MHLDFDLRQLERALGRSKARVYSKNALKKAFLAALYEAQSYTAEEHLSAPGRHPEPAWPISEHRLRTYTGRMRQDWLANKPQISTSGGRFLGSLNSGVKYSRFHDRSDQRQPLRHGVKGATPKMRDILEKTFYNEITKAMRM